jgi:hypothetical protein
MSIVLPYNVVLSLCFTPKTNQIPPIFCQAMKNAPPNSNAKRRKNKKSNYPTKNNSKQNQHNF